MAHPVDILKSEHRRIEQTLDRLESLVSADQPVLVESELAAILEFITGFADAEHHHKEEDQLFPMLEQKGFSREGGPVGVMLREHEQGRAHVRAMRQNMAGAASGDQASATAFRQHALGYVQLLRNHIWKEDNILFELARQVMTADEADRMAASFERQLAAAGD